MKISKHLHSCLLVEENETTILIDPGNYTAEENALNLDTLAKLDFLLITHEHLDHFYPPFIKTILAKFPQVKIISNPSIVNLLQTDHIEATSDDHAVIKFEVLTHERLWDREPPQNAVFTIFNKLTHPGDSLHFTESAEVLALPLQAPWGSTNQAVEKALLLKPKVIIPIHDWQWKNEVRKNMYERLHGFFKTQGIDFTSPETGETIEI